MLTFNEKFNILRKPKRYKLLVIKNCMSICKNFEKNKRYSIETLTTYNIYCYCEELKVSVTKKYCYNCECKKDKDKQQSKMY